MIAKIDKNAEHMFLLSIHFFGIICFCEGSSLPLLIRVSFNTDMTITNTSVFGVMFEVGLHITSFKISSFVDKPLFIHTSETP